MMSTDNPTQLLTTHDLSQLRGQLQTTAAATTAAAVAAAAAATHGYRSVGTATTTAASTISASNGHGNGNGHMNSGSKYVFLQHNGSSFTAYENSAAAASTQASNATGGNIVLLATEALELSPADALATAAAAAADDGELRPLSWLNDSNLIKGIVTTTTAAAAAAVAASTGATTTIPHVKRVAATAVVKATTAAANIYKISDIIEELSPNSSIIDANEQQPAEQQQPPPAVYSTTTVHKGPSGTTTVVEYKAASKVNANANAAGAYLSRTVNTFVPSTTATVVVKQPQQQQQQQQIYVSSNGTSGTTTAGYKSTGNTTTHHPHKKYLREKMNVHVEISNNSNSSNSNNSNNSSSSNIHNSNSHVVASTVTVVSSPASSNNSALNSCSVSASHTGSVSSTVAVNGGNSPLPKVGSFNAVFDAINYVANNSASNSSSNSNINTNNTINNIINNNNTSEQHTTASTVVSTTTLPSGYSFVSHVGSVPYVISSSQQPANIASPETPPGAALLPPGAYYSTVQSSRSIGHLQVSVTPPPTSSATAMHNGSGCGSGSGSVSGSTSGGIANLRSPNSYASYENEDSLKEFDLVAGNARMHTSTPQYQAITKNDNSSSNNNNNNNNNNNSNTGGSYGSSIGENKNNNNTPQKQKHPNNVPYDPFVHTNNKPPYSFSSLIFMAIEDSNEKALPVKEIYAWIVQHFPYFKTAPNGWKNSVRHNLSLNKSFVKVEKAPNMGKGSLWRVEPQQRQNLMQALNRSPYFPNSAVDKISPMLKSPNQNAAGVGIGAGAGAGIGISIYGNDSLDGMPAMPTAAVTPITPAKSNSALPLANGGSHAVTSNGSSQTTAGSVAASHARFDPQLFPNLSKAFRNIGEDQSQSTQLLGDMLDEDLNGDYVTNNNNNIKYNFATLNGSSAVGTVPVGAFNFERLARDCGADSIDDVHAAAAMLFLKHGSKAFGESFQNGAPVITSSPSEDHTYSAGGNSNADSGASTPLTNGNGQTAQQTQPSVSHHGADSNCGSSDAAYDSSEENHNITPEELADQQRHRDGVDALLSLSRSSIVECGSSTTTTHYHSNGSSGSSHGSPHKRASSRSMEEEHHQQQLLLQQHHHQQQHHHHHHHHQQQQQQQHCTSIYTNGSGSKMALLSSAAANVAAAAALAQQQQQQQQQQQLYDEIYSVTGTTVSGSNSTSSLYMPGLSCITGAGGANGQPMLQQHLSAAMASAVAAKSKVKPLRGLRTKIKRKAAWMR